MDDIYREYILEHYREPRNHGHLEHPTIAAADTNPLCGDRIEIDLIVGDDGRVTAVRFTGRGCALTQQDILEMLGVTIGPARQRCALLGLRVLHQGIGGPYTGQMDDEDEDLDDE